MTDIKSTTDTWGFSCEHCEQQRSEEIDITTKTIGELTVIVAGRHSEEDKNLEKFQEFFRAVMVIDKLVNGGVV